MAMTKQQAADFTDRLEKFIEAKINYIRTVAIEDSLMLNSAREDFLIAAAILETKTTKK